MFTEQKKKKINMYTMWLCASCWLCNTDIFTVAITNWLTVTKSISILQWQWIFSLKNRSVPSSIIDKTFTGLRVTRRVSYVKQELVTLCEHHGSPPFLFSWWDPCCASFWISELCFSFCLSAFFVLQPVSLDCQFSIALLFSLSFT